MEAGNQVRLFSFNSYRMISGGVSDGPTSCQREAALLTTLSRLLRNPILARFAHHSTPRSNRSDSFADCSLCIDSTTVKSLLIGPGITSRFRLS